MKVVRTIGFAVAVLTMQMPSTVIAQGLPEGAKLYKQAPVLIDGLTCSVVFYTLGDDKHRRAVTGILGPEGCPRWSDVSDGRSFAPPTEVADIFKLGSPQIVAFRLVGASCQGLLSIFSVSSSGVTSVTPETGSNPARMLR